MTRELTRRQALIELRDKVKAGTARMPDATRCYGCKDGRIDKTWGWKDNNVMGAYNGFLDAAKALHEAVLPGWVWLIDCDEAEVKPSWETTDGYDAEIEGRPARAWLLAILEALIAQEGQP